MPLRLPIKKARRQPTAIDLFSGAGGLALGLEWSGFDLRVAVDSDAGKAVWLARNHPRVKVLGTEGSAGDLRLIRGQDILAAGDLQEGELDLLVGCPPCQGYSLLGNRNVRDRRNYLYRHFLRLVSEMKPRAVGFENVPGMLSIGDGRFVADLVGSLEGLGYGVASGLVNASRFGVPQGRQRFFAIGLSDDAPSLSDGTSQPVAAGDAIADLPTRPLIPGEAATTEIAYSSQPQDRLCQGAER